MKKILLLALLAIVSVSAFAKKSYIEIRYNSYYYYYRMTGDVPKGIENINYIDEGTINEYAKFDGNIGILLNILSEFGYEVEFTTGYNDYLLSKEIPSNPTGKDGDVNKDGKTNVSDITALVNIILGIVRDNPSLLEVSR